MQRDTSRLLDAYLVASARAGSRSAREALAKRWHTRLVAHAMRLSGEPDLAEDAVQAAWAEIMRGLHRLRDEQAFAAWAFRIVSRACAKEIDGKVRRRALTKAVAEEPAVNSVEPSEPSEMSALRRAIRQLPPGERAAIALYHYEELSVAEVAVALTIPVGTVKSRLANARTKLRRLLEGEHHDHENE